MTVKIKLTAQNGKGVDYNEYVASYFADFTLTGWPYILGGDNTFEGEQIVLLDDLADKPADTKALILDGKNFFYYFTGHILSGKLETVRLATLGDSYNKKDGSFDQTKEGLIDNVSTAIKISGLSISNPKEVEGDLHDVIAALMGGDHSGGLADPDPLFAFINGAAQKLTGSNKGDTYSGTEFGDMVSGLGGSDRLSGMGGNDTIKGGDGNDTLSGGEGKDTLKGGAGKDSFVFDTAPGASKVDTVLDFNAADDTIHLDNADFLGLADGALSAAEFHIGAAATDAAHRVIYDKATGALYFDADGSGTAEVAIKFAVLAKNLDLTAADFLVI
jgi:Ca2+-binding RTX toxin-like protein